MTFGTDDADGTSPADEVAREAGRLAETLAEWARSTSGGRADAGPREREPGESAATCGCGGSAAVETVCRICPVCRAAAAVQAIQPEMIERVADLLSMVAGSLQAIAEDRKQRAKGPGE